MTRYTVDAVALARYLVDELPEAADRVFTRAERGVDVVEAPPVTVGETLWTIVNKRRVAGVRVDADPDTVLTGLVERGPVRLASTDRRALAVTGSLIDHHSMHDAFVIATHRVRDTAAILTNDGAFGGEETVWT